MQCIPTYCSSSSNSVASSADVTSFLDAAGRRIRTQSLRAEQLRQEAEEARLEALKEAQRSNRMGTRDCLQRCKRLEAEYAVELQQRQTLEEALAIVKRAISNQSMAQQLGSANGLLAALAAASPDVSEAMDTLRDHGARVAMDAAELAAPVLAMTAAAAEDIDDDELDHFLATHLPLPDAPQGRQPQQQQQPQRRALQARE